MSTTFSRSMRSLQTDGFGGALTLLGVALVLLLGWGAWFFFADVALYEVSESARLEVDREAHALRSLVTGRVARNDMALGALVSEGEILLELDSKEVAFELQEKQAEAAGLSEQLARLHSEIGAEEQALAQAREGETSALAERRAEHQQAIEAAEFAESEAERQTSLHEQGLVSRATQDAAQALAKQLRASADAFSKSLERLENDRRFEQSEKQAQLSELARRVAEVEASVLSLKAVENRLEHELDQHRLRAPIAGRIGDLVTIKVGDVVTSSQRLGTVIPEGDVRVVAEFAPHHALGRIHSGQRGKLRLRGFSWVQYGSVPAIVTTVASEPQNGFVRVELSLQDPSGFPVPLEHGLPGTLEIEVERISPAKLVMRAAGDLVSRPVS